MTRARGEGPEKVYVENFASCHHCGWFSKRIICQRCGRERDSGIKPLDYEAPVAIPDPPAQEKAEHDFRQLLSAEEPHCLQCGALWPNDKPCPKAPWPRSIADSAGPRDSGRSEGSATPVPRGQEERRQLLEILYEHCYTTDDLVASFRSLAEHKRNLQLTCQNAGIVVGIDGRALYSSAQPVPRDEVMEKLEQAIEHLIVGVKPEPQIAAGLVAEALTLLQGAAGTPTGEKER